MSSNTQIPKGWRSARLGDVAEVNPRRPPLNVSDGTPITFLPMSAVAENCSGILAREVRPFSEVAKGYTYFEENDLLFSKITPCLQNGKHTLATGLKGGFGFGTTEFHVVRSDSSLMPKYLFRISTQSHIIDHCAKSFTGTAGQQRVQPETLKALPILLPPLPEQRAIAAVLDSIDDAIEGAEAVIAATGQLRDSLLHQLLTRGVPGWHTEWKDVPGLGTIPADWEVVRLGEDITHVGPRRPVHLTLGSPGMCESRTLLMMDAFGSMTVASADPSQVAGYELEPGDLLFARRWCHGGGKLPLPAGRRAMRLRWVSRSDFGLYRTWPLLGSWSVVHRSQFYQKWPLQSMFRATLAQPNTSMPHEYSSLFGSPCHPCPNTSSHSRVAG